MESTGGPGPAHVWMIAYLLVAATAAAALATKSINTDTGPNRLSATATPAPAPPRYDSSGGWTDAPLLFISNSTHDCSSVIAMLNDQTIKELSYFGCPPTSAPLTKLIYRYSRLTNQGVPLAMVEDTYSLSFRQDSMGRLWFISEELRSYHVSYIVAPATANQTTTNVIRLPQPPQINSTTGWRILDLAVDSKLCDSVVIAYSLQSNEGLSFPSLLHFNLTSSTYTTIFTQGDCFMSAESSYPTIVHFDPKLDSFLVICNYSSIYGIPRLALDSPYLSVPPIDGELYSFLRLNSNDLALYYDNSVETVDCVMLVSISSNGTTSNSTVVSCYDESCADFSSWTYSPTRDSILIACQPLASGSTQVIQIQSSGGSLSVADAATIETVALGTICTGSWNLDTVAFDPFSSGFVGLCPSGAFLHRGRAVSVLTPNGHCGSLGLQADSATGLTFAGCDGSLLVVAGSLSRKFPVCNAIEILVFIHSSVSGKTFVVVASGQGSKYLLCAVEPITRGMVELNIRPTSTIVMELTNSETWPRLHLAENDSLFIITTYQVIWLNSSGVAVNIPPPYPYCDAFLYGISMNDHMYIVCQLQRSAISLLQLEVNTTFTPLLQSLDSICAFQIETAEVALTFSSRSLTSQLYLTCTSDGLLNLLLINCTDPMNVTTELVGFQTSSSDDPSAYSVVVDQTSSLVVLYSTSPMNQDQLFIYDQLTGEVSLNSLSSQYCDEVMGAGINQNSGTFFFSCGNGNVVALVKDFNCPEGYEWTPQEQCSMCSIGSARSMVAANSFYVPQCAPCLAGSIATLPGSTQCEPCPIGRFQDSALDQQVCSFCQPGKYQNMTGSIECEICPSGQFSSNVGLASCQFCPPGRYASLNTSAVCQLCDRGSASSVWGLNTTCPLCQPGTEQLQYGGLTCSSCPLGSFAPQGDPCSTCPLNSYQATIGRPCIPCDGADQDGLYCEGGLAYVKEGWFAYQIYNDQLNEWIYLTTECPSSFCPGSPLQVSNSSSVNGTDDSIQYCTYPRLNSPQNLLCAECADAYIVWGQECVQCNQANPLALVLITIFLFIIVLFLLRSSTTSAGHLNILLFFIQTAALELRQRATHSTTNWIQIFNLGFLSFNTCVGPLTPLQQILFMYLSPFLLFGLLILIGCLHRLLHPMRLLPRWINKFSLNRYLACIISILLFCYTNVTVTVVQTLNCVEVTPGVSVLWSQPTIDCSSDGYHQILILTIVWLVVYVIGFPTAIFFFLLRRHFKATRTATVASTNPDLHQSGNLVSSDSHHRPIDVDLKNDLSEPLAHSLSLLTASVNDSSTFDPSYARQRILAGVDSSTGGRWVGLFLAFTHSSWYWQSWILVRRFGFALISVLLYQSPTLSFVLFTALNIFCLLIHQTTQPFTNPILNRIDTYSYVLLVTISLILAGASTSSNASGVIEIVLLGLIVLPAAAFLIYTLRVRLRQARKRKERQLRTVSFMLDTSPPHTMPETMMEDHESEQKSV